MTERRTLFFTMVDHPAKGWMRVGNAYPSKEAAREWLPIVRGSWRYFRVKVSQCTIRFSNGSICEKSRRILDQKFNLDC